MLGLMFNLVERYLIGHGGDAALERALSRAGLTETDPWLDSLQYPDADFERWLAAAAQEQALSPAECGRAVARGSIPRLLRRYRSLSFGYKDPLSLIADMPGTLYPNLHRMLGADTGLQIRLLNTDGEQLTIESRSGASLCPIIDGLLLGLGDHYGVALQIDQTQCQVRGDAVCRYEVRRAVPAATDPRE